MKIITQRDIVFGLRKLGVEPGMDLEVHSSLKSFGYVEGWAATTFHLYGTYIRPQFRNWGHVGLMLADGRVIHAWEKVGIDDYSVIAALSVPTGSATLRDRGWTPLYRVLLGMQRQPT